MKYQPMFVQFLDRLKQVDGKNAAVIESVKRGYKTLCEAVVGGPCKMCGGDGVLPYTFINGRKSANYADGTPCVIDGMPCGDRCPTCDGTGTEQFKSKTVRDTMINDVVEGNDTEGNGVDEEDELFDVDEDDDIDELDFNNPRW